MSENDSDRRGAGVRFPPPLVVLLFILAGYGLERVFASTLLDAAWATYAGGLVLGAGIALLAMCAGLFRRARTHIEPWKPTSTIITSGIYAFSRNPIYLGFCLILAGIGLLSGNLWMVLLVLPAAACIYLIAIRREEAYLERKFGEEYLAYKRQVRRWL